MQEENTLWICCSETWFEKSPALLLPLLEPYNQMPVLQTHIPKKRTGLEHTYDPGEQTERNETEYTRIAFVLLREKHFG